MINNHVPFTKAVLLYSGREVYFNFKDWIEAVRGVPNTLCICRIRGRERKVFGMYTDIPWSDDGENHKGTGKSFIFRSYREKINPQDPKDHKYKTKLVTHHPYPGVDEVLHSTNQIFAMASGPAATGGDCMSYAYDFLGPNWKAQGVPLRYKI